MRDPGSLAFVAMITISVSNTSDFLVDTLETLRIALDLNSGTLLINPYNILFTKREAASCFLGFQITQASDTPITIYNQGEFMNSKGCPSP